MPVANSVLRQVTGSEGFIERRKTARLDIPLKVNYRIVGEEKFKGARTINVSTGGCLLLTTEELLMESELEFEVFLRESESEALKLKGKILRIHRHEEGLFEYGISFGEIGKEAGRLFADFCFAKMYEMIGLSEWPTDKKQRLADSAEVKTKKVLIPAKR